MGPYGETMGEGVDAKRMGKALDFAWNYGNEDGDHHKMWVVDQMVRALLGCPEVTLRSRFPDVNGNHYDYQGQGESEAYRLFVASTEGGWDEGIAP